MIDLAHLADGQLVYGLYEEVEDYADKENTWVDQYYDYVNPSTVYKHFKYVGKRMHDPYVVSTPWNYEKGEADVKDKW